jgi:hypothetical protein
MPPERNCPAGKSPQIYADHADQETQSGSGQSNFSPGVTSAALNHESGNYLIFSICEDQR